MPRSREQDDGIDLMKLVKEFHKLSLAQQFAEMVHATHRYDDLPYMEGHISVVAQVFSDAGMTSDDDQIIALLHDTIEDVAGYGMQCMAREFIEANFSNHVYQSVWAMSGMGASRKIRNADIYQKVGAYPPAANYKLGDRIANAEKGLASASRDKKSFISMYSKEDAEFSQHIADRASNPELRERYRRCMDSMREYL